MRTARVVVAVAGLVAAGLAVLFLPTDRPVGPVLEGPSELEVQDEGRWSDGDWQVFAGAVRRALEARVDTLPFGEAVAAVGRGFVGTTYVPGTLEVDGPERVVVNFRGLDCVTFVENALAITRFVRSGGPAMLTQRTAAEARYEELLREIRYRGGVLDGYPSRLHYFSEWLADNARRGLLQDLGPSLETDADPEPIDFMSTHTDAYRQLGDVRVLEEIRRTEARLSARARLFVPEDRIAAVAPLIRTGDVIAATSSVPGLDVAHTGLALWIDGELRLMHAPLVGDSVQISEVSLAERIRRIGGQDGIMVARPLER